MVVNLLSTEVANMFVSGEFPDEIPSDAVKMSGGGVVKYKFQYLTLYTSTTNLWEVLIFLIS